MSICDTCRHCIHAETDAGSMSVCKFGIKGSVTKCSSHMTWEYEGGTL